MRLVSLVPWQPLKKKWWVGCKRILMSCSQSECKEKKELLEEELDKLFLKNICSEIMDEVMDLGGDCDVMLSESHNRKKGSKKGKRLFRPKK
jgi:hypothetical protein